MKNELMVLVLAALALTVVALAGCAVPAPAPPPQIPASPAPPGASMPSLGGTPPSQSPQTVSIDLVSKGMAFNTSTMSVPAGASVTINFNNQDAGIPHNFALYTDAGASKAVYVGETTKGPSTAVYHFTAPDSPGSYFFRCDTHPGIMKGTFVVTPAPQL
jgi:plastocyanin